MRIAAIWGLILVLCVGAEVISITTIHWEKAAISHHAAHYSQTGAFTWNDQKEDK